MSFYQDQVLPRIQDKVMNGENMRDIRARVCTGLSGQIVEVGFGTGLNAAHYPAEVAKVAAVEPSSLCMRIAQPRIAATSAKVDLAGLTGESLDLGSEEFDGALSTWTLCTIPDVDNALREIHRVLKPGGKFQFVEHGHSPDHGVARWQARVEPLWKHVAGGCHLTRGIAEHIEQSGFHIETLDTYYNKGEPKIFGYTYEGIATKTRSL
jgi:ubiquinone/menaquinone biosynthesis C-methylase UbiE